MIITLKKTAEPSCVDTLKKDLSTLGFTCKDIDGASVKTLHIIGDTTTYDSKKLYAYECVDNVLRIQEPFKKVNRDNQPEKTTIKIRDVIIGGPSPVYIAGPCSVESQTQINQTAAIVKKAGAHLLRGGAFKPRTSPYNFQGLGEAGLKMLKTAADEHQLATISEIVSEKDLPLFERYVDVIQIGARNMQNFELLKALGKTTKPILLKRGFGNTVEEWLMSAEYILTHGNNQVILCERGIRTFEDTTRATLDISAIIAAKNLSHLPVIFDPSHAAGRWDLVEGLAKAGIAAGADGVMVEVHPDPARAMSDGAQALKPEKFIALINTLNAIAKIR